MRSESGPESWAQVRFINKNMETHGRSQPRQRRMGKSQRDHSKIKITNERRAKFLGDSLRAIM